jgi:uncharacterized membrane protein YoaK (UPF0700 family)
MSPSLPRWVWCSAWALACMAGMVNVVGLMGLGQHTISHLTGTTSMLGLAFASGNLPQALHMAALIGAFVVGSTLSGFLIRGGALQHGQQYGVGLALAAALLFLAVPLLQRAQISGLYVAACACGLQNAMVSTFSGALVRTTHLSGMFTDLGIFAGQALRGLPVDRQRLGLYAVVITGFFSGGVAGAWLFQSLGYAALMLPAGITAAFALAYAILVAPTGRST